MNTKEPFVITISREVGSGGHTVGSTLAKKLGVRYCDKMLIESLEKQFGMSAREIEKMKGEKKSPLKDFLMKYAILPSLNELEVESKDIQEYRIDATSEDIFKAEVEILQGLAEMGSCVIAGRSGFFVLKDHPNKLDVFITASMPHRIGRIMKKQGLSEEEAVALIGRIDQARETYTQRYAGVSRFDARNYDLVLNADNHTEEQLADLILKYIG